MTLPKMTDELEQMSKSEIEIILKELHSVLKAGVTGDAVEFGCYTGKTSILIQKELLNSKKILHVYDSFEGLPQKSNYDQSPLGGQFIPGELCASKKLLLQNFKREHMPLPIIHKGWFSDLSALDVPQKICFAFLDGDYYESIYNSLQLVWTRLQPFSKIIIDDYTSEALPGVQKAVNNWLRTHRIKKYRVQASLIIITV